MTADLVSGAALDRAASMLQAAIGLRPESALRSRLNRCIRAEARTTGQRPDGYVEALSRQPEVLQRLVNRMTIQETGFFRHPEQFRILAERVLPELDTPVRIWSAGCANGQEAYSLAMLLVEQGVDGWVLATDTSTAALQRTDAAHYAPRELAGLSAARLARHFVPAGQGWQVNDEVRARVSVRRHNLLDPLPDRVRSCDIVLCRNVLIYLSAEHAGRLLDRVADALGGSGHLFIGAAETLWQVSDRFEPLRVDDSYVYRPRPVEAAGDQRPVAARPALPGTPAARTSHLPPAAEPSAPPPPEAPPAATVAAEGHRAHSAGSAPEAITAYRKWVYLEPDDPVAHLHLALALEAAGDHPAAQRAFGAARRLIGTADRDGLEAAMEGYSVDEVVRLLDVRIAGSGPATTERREAVR